MSTQTKTPNHTSTPRPLYGEAAAIYAMYQSVFLEHGQDRKPPPPRKPRAGLRERFAAAVNSLLPAPAFAEAPAYARVTR